jgi:nucleotide-binding universal stress UspA family protein
MPRFLVPVDFSPISINAALYAVQMAEQMPKKEVILFNVTEEIHAGVDGTPIDSNGDALIAANLAALENLQVSLFELGMSPMEIVAEVGELQDKLRPAIARYNIDMIVMGIKGTSSYDDLFLGKNALELSRSNSCPVMIVPPEAMFKGSSKIAIAIELYNVEKTVSLAPIKKWLDILRPELHLLYIAPPGNTKLTPLQLEQKQKLEEIFSGYSTVFNTIESRDFNDGINHYIDYHGINQIIVFPKKHSLFNNIFSNDHTRRLAYHSHVPVLTVHE